MFKKRWTVEVQISGHYYGTTVWVAVEERGEFWTRWGARKYVEWLYGEYGNEHYRFEAIRQA